MRSNRYFLMAALILAGAGVAQGSEKGDREHKKTEVGAWFGSAVPTVCNVPSEAGGCPETVMMMPEIMEDGTMVATDSGSFADGHLMGQGNWTKLHGNSGIGATFLWFQPAEGGGLGGVFRVRFLGHLDRGDQDTMRGTIEPYFFPLEPNGEPLPGIPDPLISPLPECSLLNGCLGTFEFVVRRIPTE